MKDDISCSYCKTKGSRSRTMTLKQKLLYDFKFIRLGETFSIFLVNTLIPKKPLSHFSLNFHFIFSLLVMVFRHHDLNISMFLLYADLKHYLHVRQKLNKHVKQTYTVENCLIDHILYTSTMTKTFIVMIVQSF